MNEETKCRIKDWKTTIPALVSAISGFILFAPEYFDRWPILYDIAKYTFSGGLAAFGINAVSGNLDNNKKEN
jgi:hypothetical protein